MSRLLGSVVALLLASSAVGQPYRGLVNGATGAFVPDAATLFSQLPEAPVVRKVVGAGGDFATLAEALAWVNTKQQSYVGLQQDTLWQYETGIELTLAPGSYAVQGPLVVQYTALKLTAETAGTVSLQMVCGADGHGLVAAPNSLLVIDKLTVTGPACSVALVGSIDASVQIFNSEISAPTGGFATAVYGQGGTVSVQDTNVTGAYAVYLTNARGTSGGSGTWTSTVGSALTLDTDNSVFLYAGNSPITLSSPAGQYALAVAAQSEFLFSPFGTGNLVLAGAGGGIGISSGGRALVPTSDVTFSQAQADYNVPLNEIQPDGGYIADSDSAGLTLDADRVPVALSPTNYTAATPDVEAHLVGLNTALGGLAGGHDAVTVVDTATVDLTLGGVGGQELSAAVLGVPNDSVTPDNVLSTGQVDEYCLTYELTGDTWEWQACGSGGGATQLSDLLDVNTSTPTNQNFLVADGVDWESRAALPADIGVDNDLASLAIGAGVTIAASANLSGTNTGDQNAAGVSVAATPTNYTAATPDVEAHLAGIDGALGTVGGGATQLSELSDVNTSTPTAGNFLVADGVDWESRAATPADVGMDPDAATLAIAPSSSVSGSNTGDQTITLTGDVTGTGTGSFATTISADSVGTAELDDGADTPAARNVLHVDPADTTQVIYYAAPSGGTDGCAGTADKVVFNSTTGTWGCGVDAGAGGGMTGFTVAGDTGGGQSITDGNTLSLLGGTAITTADSVADTVTFSVDVATLEPLLSLQNLGGAVTDAQVPDTITVSLAATATALAVNGANCLAGSYPLGVDASGVVEGCTDATTEISSLIGTHAAIADAHHAPVSVLDTASVDLTLTGQQVSAVVLPAGVNHDLLSGFVLNEHIDWTADQGATDINAANIPDLSAVYEPAGITVADVSDLDPDAATLTIAASSSISGTNTGDQTLIFFQERTISAPDGTDDYLWFKAPAALTLTNFDCVAEGTTPSVVVDLQECDANGTTCVTVLSAPVTANGGNDAGTITDTAVDSGDWMKMFLGTVTGTVTGISCTLRGTL